MRRPALGLYIGRVRKYHDIFENIKISKISKISWYFRYVSDIFDTFKNAPVMRVGQLNHVKIVKHSIQHYLTCQ